MALNQATVGTAILTMNQSPGLDHVDLASVQQQKTGKVDTVSFQMTVHLKPEAAPTRTREGRTMSKSLNAGTTAAPKRSRRPSPGSPVLTLAAGGGLVFWLNGADRRGPGHGRQPGGAGRQQRAGRQAPGRDAKPTYDQMQSRIAILEASVSEKSFVPTLLQQLQTLAAATHLTVSSVPALGHLDAGPAAGAAQGRRRRQRRGRRGRGGEEEGPRRPPTTP